MLLLSLDTAFNDSEFDDAVSHLFSGEGTCIFFAFPVLPLVLPFEVDGSLASSYSVRRKEGLIYLPARARTSALATAPSEWQ